jgi:pilus assembly protein Flp/PilA
MILVLPQRKEPFMSMLVLLDVLRPSVRDERGQTMAEYGVVLALITLAVLASMTLLGNNISTAFNDVGSLLP